MRLRGTRFWVTTAAVSACGTLSTLVTAATTENRNLIALLPEEAFPFFMLLVFFAALGASAIAVMGILVEGIQETGEFPPLCLVCYAAPWVTLALLFALV